MLRFSTMSRCRGVVLSLAAVSCLVSTALCMSKNVCETLCPGPAHSHSICRPVGRGNADYFCLPKTANPCAQNIYYCKSDHRCQVTSYLGHNFKICTPLAWNGKVSDHVKPELLLKHGYKLTPLGTTAPTTTAKTTAKANHEMGTTAKAPSDHATSPRPNVAHILHGPVNGLPAKTSQASGDSAGTKCGSLRCQGKKKCAYFFQKQSNKTVKAYVCLNANPDSLRIRKCSASKTCPGNKACRKTRFFHMRGNPVYSLCIGRGNGKCRGQKCKKHRGTEQCGRYRCSRHRQCGYFAVRRQLQSGRNSIVRVHRCVPKNKRVLALRTCGGNKKCVGSRVCRNVHLLGGQGPLPLCVRPPNSKEVQKHKGPPCGPFHCPRNKKCAYFFKKKNAKTMKAYVCLKDTPQSLRARKCSDAKTCPGKKVCRKTTFLHKRKEIYSLCIGKGNGKCQTKCRKQSSLCGRRSCSNVQQCGYYFIGGENKTGRTRVHKCIPKNKVVLGLRSCGTKKKCGKGRVCREVRTAGGAEKFPLCVSLPGNVYAQGSTKCGSHRCHHSRQCGYYWLQEIKDGKLWRRTGHACVPRNKDSLAKMSCPASKKCKDNKVCQTVRVGSHNSKISYAICLPNTRLPLTGAKCGKQSCSRYQRCGYYFLHRRSKSGKIWRSKEKFCVTKKAKLLKAMQCSAGKKCPGPQVCHKVQYAKYKTKHYLCITPKSSSSGKCGIHQCGTTKRCASFSVSKMSNGKKMTQQNFFCVPRSKKLLDMMRCEKATRKCSGNRECRNVRYPGANKTMPLCVRRKPTKKCGTESCGSTKRCAYYYVANKNGKGLSKKFFCVPRSKKLFGMMRCKASRKCSRNRVCRNVRYRGANKVMPVCVWKKPAKKCGTKSCGSKKQCVYYYAVSKNGKGYSKKHFCIPRNQALLEKKRCEANRTCSGNRVCRNVRYQGTNKVVPLCMWRKSTTKCGTRSCSSWKRCAYYYAPSKTNNGVSKKYVCVPRTKKLLDKIRCHNSGKCSGRRVCRKVRFQSGKKEFAICLWDRSSLFKPCYNGVYCRGGTRCGYSWRQGAWTKKCLALEKCGQRYCRNSHECVEGKCKRVSNACGKDGKCGAGEECRATRIRGADTKQCLPKNIERCTAVGHWCSRGLLCGEKNGVKGCMNFCGKNFCRRGEKCTYSESPMPTCKKTTCSENCKSQGKRCKIIFKLSDESKVKSEFGCVAKTAPVCGSKYYCGKGLECKLGQCVKSDGSMPQKGDECPCIQPTCYTDASCSTKGCPSKPQYVCLSEVASIVLQVGWNPAAPQSTCERKKETRQLYYRSGFLPGAAKPDKCSSKAVSVATPKGGLTIQSVGGYADGTCVCEQDPAQEPGWCYTWANPANSVTDKTCNRKRCEKSWTCSASQVLTNGKLPDGSDPDICRRKRVLENVLPETTGVFGGKCIGIPRLRHVWVKIEQ